MAPIGATGSRSKIGVHDAPPLVLLKTPPPAPPA